VPPQAFDLDLKVSSEEAVGNLLKGTDGHDSFLGRYLREDSGSDFIYANLDSELKEMILKGCRYKKKRYETFVPALIRVYARDLLGNKQIKGAVENENRPTLQKGLVEVKILLESREEHKRFLYTLFGLDQSWSRAGKGAVFDIALKGLKLALATLPFGLGIAAEAGLGIAQGLWKRTRGDATASVLGGLAEAGGHWREMSEEEQRFFCYRLEREKGLEPDTTFPFYRNYFDPGSGFGRRLEEYVEQHAPEIWAKLEEKPEVRDLLRSIHLFSQRLGEIEQRLTALEQRLAQVEQELTTVKTHVAELTYKLGRFEEAITSAGTTQGNEGIDLYRLGRFAEALAQYDRTILLNPSEPAPHNNKGASLHKLGQYEDALAEYDLAIRLNPSDPDYFYNKGLAFVELGLFEEALVEYGRAIQLDPDDPRYHAFESVALTRLDRHDDALVEIAKAVELDPTNPDYRLKKGNRLSTLGQFEEALVEYDLAIQLDPSEPLYHDNKGLACAKLGRHADAVMEHDQAILLNRSNPDYHSNKANALSNLGRFREASVEFDLAIQLDPSDPDYHSNEGNALCRLARLEEALVEYDRAIQLNPSEPSYHDNKAIALSNLGRDAEAFAESEKAQL